MSAPTLAPEAPRPGFAAGILGMFNIFIDPQAAAKVVPLDWSWVWPLALTGIVIGVTNWLQIPNVVRIMQYNPPGNMTGEQLERALPMILMTQKIMAFALPVIIGIITALVAGLLSAACGVLDIASTFRNNLALLAQGSLFGALQQLAGFFVIRLKGDAIQSLAELRPAFGFDLLLPDGASGVLRGFLGYFSLFNIWYIVVLGLAFHYLTRTSKGKAFTAITPVWVLGLLLSIVGGYFNR